MLVNTHLLFPHERYFDVIRMRHVIEHLTELDAIAHAYFGSEDFHAVVREKVDALFPDHEVDEFTEHFFGLVQFWRKTEGDRLGVSVGGAG